MIWPMMSNRAFSQVPQERIDSMLEMARKSQEEIREKSKVLEEELKAGDDQLKELEAEVKKLRLAIDAATRRQEAEQNIGIDPADPQPATPDIIHPNCKRIHEKAGEAIITVSRDGQTVGTAFACNLMGKKLILCPSQNVNAGSKLTFRDTLNRKIPVEENVMQLKGISLVAFQPKAVLCDLLEFSENIQSTKPADKVIVLSVRPHDNKVTATQCVIRGIGPEVFEVDGEELDSLWGRPALSLESGKVIGIITPSIDGVAAEWALGTRHVNARHFIARADLAKDSEQIDAGRLKREYEWLRQFSRDIEKAGVCHNYMETMRESRIATRGSARTNFMSRREILAEIHKHKDHAFVERLIKLETSGQPRGPGNNEESIYRAMILELEKKCKLSGKFTWHNEAIYQADLKNCKNLIDVMRKEAGIRK